MLEGATEGGVAAEAAFVGQLLGGEGSFGGDGLAVVVDEMLYAQLVDVGIVGLALLCEVEAEVGAVGADGLAEVVARDVVLQIEPGVFAVLLEQLADVGGKCHGCACFRTVFGVAFRSEVGQFYSLCVGLGSMQGLQRLDSPEDKRKEKYLAKLYERLGNDGVGADGIDAEHDQQDDDDHQRQPHLLVLQVGIVVDEPPAVLSQGREHIDEIGCQECEKIESHEHHDGVVVVEQICQQSKGGRYHDDEKRPERAAAVLQHRERHAQHNWYQQGAVEYGGDDVQTGIGFDDSERVGQPPQMTSEHHGHEGCCPAAQALWRRDITHKGIDAPHQQMEAGYGSHYRCSAIEHVID